MTIAEPWQEVGDRVFVRRHVSLDLNCGLVVGDDACLVIDTRRHSGEVPGLARGPVVPGHGAVVDIEFVSKQRAALLTLVEIIRQALADSPDRGEFTGPLPSGTPYRLPAMDPSRWWGWVRGVYLGGGAGVPVASSQPSG